VIFEDYLLVFIMNQNFPWFIPLPLKIMTTFHSSLNVIVEVGDANQTIKKP
jgi:hypothetical protein